MSTTDLNALIDEALEDEPVLGPASDRDAAHYWANLARKLAQATRETLCEPLQFEAAAANDREDWPADYQFEPGIAGNAFERGWAAHAALSVASSCPVCGSGMRDSEYVDITGRECGECGLFEPTAPAPEMKEQ